MIHVLFGSIHRLFFVDSYGVGRRMSYSINQGGSPSSLVKVTMAQREYIMAPTIVVGKMMRL